ncbi:MAG: rhamnulokinase, partial [Oscillospiraceae bacterium]|nr:rhamnulokinase [Oscillospiraceae bacterium]
MKNLSFDLGASNGKMYLADFNGSRLSLEKIHSFENSPIRLADGLYWDTVNIYKELLSGLRKADGAYS